MPCLCTTTALRLFLGGLIQVELRVSLPRTSFKRLQDSSKRHFSTTQANRFQYSISKLNDVTFPDFAPLEYKNTEEAEDAVADITPESIDALAEEIASKTTLKKEASAVIPFSRSSGRRDEVADTGFRLRLSSPRANSKSLTTHKEPKADRRNLGKEEWTPPKRERWQIEKQSLKEKFPEGWKPLKKLSPDALAGIRALHAQMPEQYTTSGLAASFEVSPEAIRRILKSKWTANPEEESDRQRRWFNRGKKVWSRYAELGVKPPKPWRKMGIGKGMLPGPWTERGRRAREKSRRLPALVTTARRREKDRESHGEAYTSLAGRIL